MSRIVGLWRNPATRNRYSSAIHERAVKRFRRRCEALAKLPYRQPAWAGLDIHECMTCRHFRAREACSAGWCCHPVSPGTLGMTPASYTSLCEQWDGWPNAEAQAPAESGGGEGACLA